MWITTAPDSGAITALSDETYTTKTYITSLPIFQSIISTNLRLQFHGLAGSQNMRLWSFAPGNLIELTEPVSLLGIEQSWYWRPSSSHHLYPATHLHHLANLQFNKTERALKAYFTTARSVSTIFDTYQILYLAITQTRCDQLRPIFVLVGNDVHSPFLALYTKIWQSHTPMTILGRLAKVYNALQIFHSSYLVTPGTAIRGFDLRQT